MAISIQRDENRIFPCCIRLKGEYKIKDVFVGTPVKLNKKGIGEVIKLRLKKDELDLLHGSANAVKEIMDALDGMGVL